MRLLVLTASPNDPSNSEMLADAFIAGAKQEIPAAQIRKIRLHDLVIAPFTLDCYRPGFHPEPDFQLLQDAVTEADGLVIATPVWNFSVPGNLKNLIDRFGGFALDTETRSKGMLKGKPFTVLYTGGAPTVAWVGLMQWTVSHLPEALRYYGATPISAHFEPRCVPGRGQFGLVIDKRPERLSYQKERGRAFAKIVDRFAKDGTLPVTTSLMRKLMAWGAKKLSGVGQA